MKIVTAQLNFTVGDIKSNSDKISEAYKISQNSDADLVIASEMAITGYPCEDLILNKSFQNSAIDAAKELAKITNDKTALLVGGLWREKDKIYNAAFFMQKGKISHILYKHLLPNYGVFDEQRLFASGDLPKAIEFRNKKLGILICEDMWNDKLPKHLIKQNIDLLISLNASPFEINKLQSRKNLAKSTAKITKTNIVYVNQIGGQDELVFDGGSFIMNKDGEKVFTQNKYEEEISLINLDTSQIKSKQLKHNKYFKLTQDSSKLSDIYFACMLGLRDYITKNNFKNVVLGMSGGVDSALACAIAVDALGKNNVLPVMLPSKYTSNDSLNDAKECCDLLKVNLKNIPIEKIVESFDCSLSDLFAGEEPDITEENIQSRIRGNILMALSNKFGNMLLTTGNKSEMAVGYATLYGDMCGGYNVLKDLYKMQVFELCRWRNQQSYVIPKNIIDKPPTAELRDNQKDEDSLPPYDVLDKILFEIIENRKSGAEIIAEGFDKDTVEKITRLVKLSEYKRFQAPPGVKITKLAFGRDRRLPLTCGSISSW